MTIACHASVQLQENVPPLPSSEDELEGVAGHWVALCHALGNPLAVGAKFSVDGTEWEVTQEMFSGAVLYARTCGGPRETLICETPVMIPRVHPECWGTPDARIFIIDARLIYSECPEGISPEKFHAGRVKIIRVVDYKFGFRYVEVFENAQLASYAVGYIDELCLLDTDLDLYVELILVQPRSYHRDGPVRVWRTQALQLRPIINLAAMAAEASLLPNPIATTGPHCIDCTARHACRTLQLNVRRLADYAGAAEAVELPPEAIGQELAIVEDAIEQLKGRRTGLAAQAETLLRTGKQVPHYMMAPGKSNLAYHEDVNVDELVSLGELVNVDLRRKLNRKELIVTPAQAIDLGIDPEVMKAYASRPRPANILQRIDPTTVKKVFSK